MNLWLLTRAVIVLWVVGVSLICFSLWAEKRREKKQSKTRWGKYVSPYPKVGENLTYLDLYKFDREKK
jgi:hypothetical protein